jgi:hypothetical protein
MIPGTLGLTYRYVDDDACEAGVILEYFKEVHIILDAFHLMKRYGDSTVGSQHPAHSGESHRVYNLLMVPRVEGRNEKQVLLTMYIGFPFPPTTQNS